MFRLHNDAQHVFRNILTHLVYQDGCFASQSLRPSFVRRRQRHVLSGGPGPHGEGHLRPWGFSARQQRVAGAVVSALPIQARWEFVPSETHNNFLLFALTTMRLWCVFELAAYRMANPSGRILVTPVFIEAGVLLTILGSYFASALFSTIYVLSWQELARIMTYVIA